MAVGFSIPSLDELQFFTVTLEGGTYTGVMVDLLEARRSGGSPTSIPGSARGEKKKEQGLEEAAIGARRGKARSKTQSE